MWGEKKLLHRHSRNVLQCTKKELEENGRTKYLHEANPEREHQTRSPPFRRFHRQTRTKTKEKVELQEKDDRESL